MTNRQLIWEHRKAMNYRSQNSKHRLDGEYQVSAESAFQAILPENLSKRKEKVWRNHLIEFGVK